MLGKNVSMDALLCNLTGVAPAKGTAEMETRIAVVSALMKSDIHLLLQLDPADYEAPHDCVEEQWKDEDIKQIVKYLECTW